MKVGKNKSNFQLKTKIKKSKKQKTEDNDIIQGKQCKENNRETHTYHLDATLAGNDHQKRRKTNYEPHYLVRSAKQSAKSTSNTAHTQKQTN